MDRKIASRSTLTVFDDKARKKKKKREEKKIKSEKVKDIDD